MPPLPDPITHAPQPTRDAVYKAYEAKDAQQPRTYLGMSTMGQECDRALWYGFHWAHPPEALDGRKLRLFQTGHREEARMLDDLEMAGLEIWRLDPDTGEQWAVSDLGGHFRGHMDGIATGVLEDPATEHLLEFKTHNEKSFKDLVKNGVEKSKPGHYAQMQLYMHYGDMTRAFYMAVNKNSDELHTEIVAYDRPSALRLIARASAIISGDMPSRLHEDPAAKMAFMCGYCPARGQCHDRQFAPRNCRTCLHSSTGENGSWTCDLHFVTLDEATQRAGCGKHLYIPALVPGEQVDADIIAGTVTYTMPDATEWRDGTL